MAEQPTDKPLVSSAFFSLKLTFKWMKGGEK
jgi:hypothetical protein